MKASNFRLKFLSRSQLQEGKQYSLHSGYLLSYIFFHSGNRDLSTEHLPHKSAKTNWTLALIVTLCFAFCNWRLEFTPVGHWLEFETFDLLRAALPAFEKDPLPVVVVDISKIPSYVDRPTSRQGLQQVLETIADGEPASIGIDIDFSPFAYKRPSREDGEFFEFCTALSQGKRSDGRQTAPVPIVLGINRMCFKAPEDWLGYPQYNQLAATIGVRPKDTHRIPRWITGAIYGTLEPLPSSTGSDESLSSARKGGNVRTQDGTRRLPSMSEALAEAYLTRLPAPDRSAWLLEMMPADPSREHGLQVGGEEEEIGAPAPEGFRYGLSLINYSKLEELRREKIVVTMQKGKPVVSGNFKGKMVVLGDAEVSDVFTIPGPVEPIRGVFLHASGAYTFTTRPLYGFRPVARTLLDIVLSLFLVAFLSRLDALDEQERTKRQRQRLAGVLLMVLAAGFALIRWSGIIWLDFIAIVVALALHPTIEHWLHHWWERQREPKSTLRRGPAPPAAPHPDIKEETS